MHYSLVRAYVVMCLNPNVPSWTGMKYDLRRVEEVYYDVKIRGLAPNGKLGEDQGVQGPP